MIWPVNLIACVLFNTLRLQQHSGIGSRGRLSCKSFLNLPVRVPVLVRVVLLPGVHLPGTELLQLGVLDCAEERDRKPAVQVLHQPGHVRSDVRLGADRVHRGYS